jgi:hypothetical protein
MHMFNRIIMALALTMTVGPAFAGIPVVGNGGGVGVIGCNFGQPCPGQLPEPTTITLFGVAAAGAFVVKKIWSRK